MDALPMSHRSHSSADATMRQLSIVLVLVLAAAPAVWAKLYAQVYRADGVTPLGLADPNTPFVYEPVMVGTKLTIIVSSDASGDWGSDLGIKGQDLDYGILSARDFNDVTLDWEGSHLAPAGRTAEVWTWTDLETGGFALEGDSGAVAGDWFIIDYTAMAVGQCRVGFYDRSISWDEPVYYLVFRHTPSRDFDGDARVGLGDFAVFSANWGRRDCADSDWCGGTDLDSSGTVDFADLMLFADFWLEGTQ